MELGHSFLEWSGFLYKMPNLPDSNNNNQVNSPVTGKSVWSANNKFKNKIPVYLLFLVFAVVILTAVGIPVYFKIRQNQAAASQQSAKAYNFANQGNYQSAVKEYEEAYKKDSGNNDLLAGVIFSIAAEGNSNGMEAQALEKAKPYIDKASKSDSDEASLALGYLYETAGKYNEALELYEKVIQKDSNNGYAWYRKGHVLEFIRGGQEVTDAYNRAYELDPNHAQIIVAQGRLKASAGKLDEAYNLFIDASQAANVTTSLKAEALTNASGMKRSQGYIQEALEHSTESVQIYPNSVQGLSDHGINLFIMDRPQEGIDVLNRATLANARSAQPYWWLGIALRSVEQYDDAVVNQKIGLEKIDNDNTLVGPNVVRYVKAQMTYDLAKTYWMMGNNDGALQTLQDAFKVDIRVRDLLRNDYQKYGSFKSLETNPTFNNLIQ